MTVSSWTASILVVAVLAAVAPMAALATAPQAQQPPSTRQGAAEPSQEELYRSRFPQTARVGFLIGLPVLDWRDSTIGYVRDIVRTPDGAIKLVVPYRSRLGSLGCDGLFAWGCRPVAMPLETVAILGRQIAALDMPREAFDAAPTFEATQAGPMARHETIKIAITRR